VNKSRMMSGTYVTRRRVEIFGQHYVFEKCILLDPGLEQRIILKCLLEEE
jgi:hypothetical protein